MDATPSKDPEAEIAALDPERDYERIAFLLTYQLFPISIEKALEYALFKTYAIPSISRVLAGTGEFTDRAQKRYDDTVLLLAEIGENGSGHKRADEALARMNAIHARFRIRNEDYLYTLSTFVFEPIRFLELYGPRPMTATEARGWLNAYRHLGRDMGIEDIPDDLDAFRRWREGFEAREMTFAETNRQVADATVAVLFDLLGVPRFARRAAERALVAVMEPHVAEAFGYAPAGAPLRAAVEGGLLLRKAALRLAPARRRLRLQTGRRLPTYPGGYAIGRLGPTPFA
ncbi:MAG: oxygenase MpaB family protein [Pseudomonadota bacterium]